MHPLVAAVAVAVGVAAAAAVAAELAAVVAVAAAGWGRESPVGGAVDGGRAGTQIWWSPGSARWTP
jgi:hypothetical protein